MTFVAALVVIGALFWLYCVFTVDEPGSNKPTAFDMLVAYVIAGVLRPFLWLWEKLHDHRV